MSLVDDDGIERRQNAATTRARQCLYRCDDGFRREVILAGFNDTKLRRVDDGGKLVVRLLDEVFSTIVGYEDMREPKPAPEGLLTALTQLGATPDTTLYVGDSVTDAQAAAGAGVAFVGVLSGVTTREELAAYPHLAIMPRAGGVAAWLA